MTDFLDNFNGTGGLLAHTSDSGHVWTNTTLPYGSEDPGASKLTSGTLSIARPHVTSGIQIGYFGAYNNYVGVDGYIEAVLSIPSGVTPPTDASYQFYIGLRFTVSEPDNEYQGIFAGLVVYPAPWTTMRVSLTDHRSQIGYNPAIAIGSTTTLRLELNRTNAVVKVDGVQILSGTTDAELSGSCFLYFQQPNTGPVMTLTSLTSTIGSGVPPVTAFWQDFIKTDEAEAALLLSEAKTPEYVAPVLEPELLPPLVVNPLVVDYFLDTFDGTGNLVTHAPAIGGAYTGSGLSGLILNGAGGLAFSLSGQARSLVTVPAAPYILEAGVKFVTNPSAGQTLSFEFGLDGAGIFERIRFMVYRPSTAYTHYGSLIDSTGAIDYVFQNSSSPVLLGVQFVLRIEVDVGQVRWYLDGVLVGSRTTAMALPFTRIYFYPQVGGIGAGLVDYISSSTPAAPVPPTFWQDFDKTYEVAT